jgi:peroxiredoxin
LRDAIPELEAENIEYISISVDVGSTAAEVEAYAIQQGFDWTFAIVSDEFLREFVAQYGRAMITIPNMPDFVIQPDGSISQMFKGTRPATQLVDEIRGAILG